MPSSSKIQYDPQQSKEWKEIVKKTKVNLAISSSVNAWIRQFSKMVEEADYYLLKGDSEKAYINYVVSISIYFDCLLNNTDFLKLGETRPSEIKKIRTESKRCLEHAEKIKEKILKKFIANHEQSLLAGYEKQKYSVNHVKPEINSLSGSGISNKSVSSSSKIPKKILPAVQSSSQTKVNPYSTSTKSTKVMVKNLKISSNVATPESLVPILNSYRVNQSPTVLFIDVRPTHQFLKERLLVTHQVNIDPIILSNDIGSAKIEEHLKVHGSDLSNLFYYRNRFDYVVILDENSTRVLPPRMIEGSPQDNAIHNLIQAITEYEPSKLLKNYPILLVGGFSAWKKYTGNEGITGADGSFPSAGDYAAHSQAISPARSKTIVKTLDEFFQRQPVMENSVKPSMQLPYFPSDKDSPASFVSPEQKALSPLNRLNNLNGSSDSFHSFNSPTGSSGRASLKTTVFDNPLYGFTPTKKNLKKYLKEEPLKTLESIYQPPPGISEPTPEPILKPTKIPPPIPPKPSSLNRRRTQTPPLVSSLSYAMNIGTTGLKNLGNTCYMNSVIQCINGTIPLARYFLDGSFKRHINRENPLGSGGKLVEAFEELVRGLWTEGASNISPTKFKTTIGKISYQFKGSEQQDSQEFLNFFLDGLHEDLNLVKQRPPPDQDDDDYLEKLPEQEAADLAWEKYLARNNSIIVSLFQGQFKSRLQCKICQKTSTTYNSFMSLSLPIPYHNTAPISLIDCLNLFIQEETLEGDNAWNCPRCKRPCPSTKKLTISRLPDVLLIHLKRFSYEGPFRNKLDTLVNFPLRGLDLSRYVPPTAPKSSILSPKGTPIGNSYDLYAVSNHFGSLTGGHYTSSVRSGHGGKWHYFDDSRVTTINENDAVTKAAYNLFYVRTNRDTAHL